MAHPLKEIIYQNPTCTIVHVDRAIESFVILYCTVRRRKRKTREQQHRRRFRKSGGYRAPDKQKVNLDDRCMCSAYGVNCVYRPRTPRRRQTVRDDEMSVRFVDKTGNGKNVRWGNERPDIGRQREPSGNCFRFRIQDRMRCCGSVMWGVSAGQEGTEGLDDRDSA